MKTFIIIIVVAFLLIAINALFRRKEEEIFESSFTSPNELASRWNKGFCIGSTTKYLSLETCYKNVFICGKSGSGKGVNYICNSLFNIRRRTNASIFIFDPAGENAKITSGYAATNSIVKLIDFSNPDSEGFNPFKVNSSKTEIEQLVEECFSNAKSKTSTGDFWESAAIEFTCFLCQLIFTQPEQYRTFANVLRLLELFVSEPKIINRMVIDSNDVTLLRQLKRWYKVPKRRFKELLAT